jgi:3-oxoadipate enol-lactonase
MPTTHVRGVDISWSEEGQGSTVVFLHGLTSSRAVSERRVNWSPVVDAGHRLVTFDARGHGLSGGSANPTDYEWPALAQDLLAFLAEVAPGEQVAGIGVSMGTATLIHAALMVPDIFDCLVLAATPTAWETRRNQSAIYNTMAESVERDGMQAFLDLVATRPTLPVFADLEKTSVPPDIDEMVFPSVLRGAGDSDLPPESLVASINAPTLILAWTSDTGHPVSSAEKVHGLITGSQLSIAETPAQYRNWGNVAATFIEQHREVSH